MGKYKHVCKTCGKEFSNNKESSKFCSKECYHNYHNVTYYCDYCGKEMHVYRNVYQLVLDGKQKGIYCSKECKDKASTKKIIKQCEYCGKDFETYESDYRDRRFCSMECYRNYQKEDRLIKVCQVCGKPFIARSEKTKYCSKECRIEASKNREKCVCKFCGKEFEIRKSIVKDNGNYCSKECADNDLNWSDDDIKILVNNYNSCTAKEIQSMLSRNVNISAIRTKANKLGITNNIDWTDDEDEIIKEYYQFIPSYKVHQLLPGRSSSAIQQRANKLGYISYFNKERSYSEEEDNYIRENYLYLSDEDIANNLGRNIYGIVHRRYKLNLYKPQKIHKEGYRSLREYVRAKLGQWRENIMKERNYTCELSGKRGNINIHHSRSFNLLMEETIESLNFPILDNFVEYSDDELSIFVDKFFAIQEKYKAYICVTEDIHKLFHKLYGYGDNTEEQWEEFVNDYQSGKYKEIA